MRRIRTQMCKQKQDFSNKKAGSWAFVAAATLAIPMGSTAQAPDQTRWVQQAYLGRTEAAFGPLLQARDEDSHDGTLPKEWGWMRVETPSPSGLGVERRQQIHRGIPIWGQTIQGKGDWWLGRGLQTQDGNEPRSTYEFPSDFFPPVRVNETDFYPSGRVFRSDRQWWPTSHGLVPAWWVQVRDTAPGGMPRSHWRLIGPSGEVLDAGRHAFDAEGRAALYRENRVASRREGLVWVPLPDLVDPRILLGTTLRVFGCDNAPPGSLPCVQNVLSREGDFSVGISQTAYSEVLAYGAISRAMNWHRKVMGPKWGAHYGQFGLSQTIWVYTRSGSPDASEKSLWGGARYIPAVTADDHPYILVGSGCEQLSGCDGMPLSFLSQDADVFMHEFGHHVIYRSINAPKLAGTQAGGLHEGFADFFTYAITGNNILAESVSQARGPGMRRGNRTESAASFLKDFYKNKCFDSDQTFSSPSIHCLGEHWSSVLWEIRQGFGSTQDGVNVWDRIVWRSIDWLPSSPNFYQAAAALWKASEVVSNEEGVDPKKSQKILLDILYKRGFFASAPTRDASLPPPSEWVVAEGDLELPPPPPPPPWPTPAPETGREKEKSCGELSGPLTAKNTPLALLLIPLLVAYLWGIGLRRHARALNLPWDGERDGKS